MNDSSNNWHNVFDELVGQLRDGELTEDQSAELQSILECQPDARLRFSEHMQLAVLLEDELPHSRRFRGTSVSLVEDASRASGTLAPRGRYWTTAIALTCSLAATIALVFWFNLPANHPDSNINPDSSVAGDPTSSQDDMFDEGVAVITRAVGARWGNDARLDVGSTIVPGVLQLDAGLVQFEFYQGAVVVAEGPAKLEFVDAQKLICLAGKIRARVPPQASGFTVTSQQFELVDLGTEFGINVSSDGSASIHVFEGKVELYDADSKRSAESRRELGAASAIAVSADGTFEEVGPELSRFVSPADLQKLAEEERQSRLANWQAMSERLKTDPRVLVYFAFEQDVNDDRILRGHLHADRSLDGAIIGCAWSSGRWPGKGALEFKRPGDRVRVNVPGNFRSLTWSAWLRLDNLDRGFNSLLLTDGFGKRNPHWQIQQKGELVLGLRYHSGPKHNYRSEPLIDVFVLGRWTHLVAVYNGQTREVSHYIDGQLASREPLVDRARGPLRIGKATIGNWVNTATNRHKIRNLNGRMDELIVFKRPLSYEEVRELYDSGKP